MIGLTIMPPCEPVAAEEAVTERGRAGSHRVSS